MSNDKGEVSVSAGDFVVKLTKDEYVVVLKAIRLYDDFLKEELRNIKATIAVPEAERASVKVLEAKMEELNTIKGEFNSVSVKLAGNVKQAG